MALDHSCPYYYSTHVHMYVHTYVHYSIVTLVVVEKRKNIFYLFCLSIGEKMIGKKVYFLREARLFSVLVSSILNPLVCHLSGSCIYF